MIALARPADQSYLSVNWQSPVIYEGIGKGTVAWWLNVPHWQGGTVWRDLTGVNHATLTNMDPATAWLPASRRRGGGALELNGDDNYCAAPHSRSLGITGAITLSLWFNTSSLVGDDGGLISKAKDVSKYFSTPDVKTYEIGILNNTLFFQLSDGTTAESASASFTTYKDGAWHHLAATWDGKSGTANQLIFIDGIVVGTNDCGISSIQTVISELDIGGYTSSFNYSGRLDDARIWNRALGTSEVADYYVLSQVGYPGLLRRIESRAYSVPAVVGGLSIPVAMHHYTKNIRAA